MKFSFIKKLILSRQEFSLIEDQEKFVKEGQDRMDHLINITDEMVCTFSQEGKMLFGNRSCLSNIGYTNKELKSLSLSDILSKGSLMNVKNNFKLLIQGKTLYKVAFKLFTKSGKSICVEGTMVPIIKDGELTGSQGFFRNTQDRKEAHDRKVQYIEMLEEQLFSFSHKIRRPVATCLGLIGILNSEKMLTSKKIRQYAEYFNVSMKELDKYVHEMSDSLHSRRLSAADPVATVVGLKSVTSAPAEAGKY